MPGCQTLLGHPVCSRPGLGFLACPGLLGCADDHDSSSQDMGALMQMMASALQDDGDDRQGGLHPTRCGRAFISLPRLPDADHTQCCMP